MSDTKLTFILFGANDNQLEQKRVDLSIKSLLAQNYKDYKIWFMDCSLKKPFELPENERLKIIYNPVDTNSKEFLPSYYRNIGAFENDSLYIANVNSDCVYSNNVVQLVVKNLDKSRKNIVHCKRQETNAKQFAKINTLGDIKKIQPGLRYNNPDCCGDLQCIRREWFLSFGGYYGLIKKDKVNKPIFEQARREDTWLQNSKAQKEIWITDKAYIVHLWHSKHPR